MFKLKDFSNPNKLQGDQDSIQHVEGAPQVIKCLIAHNDASAYYTLHPDGSISLYRKNGTRRLVEQAFADRLREKIACGHQPTPDDFKLPPPPKKLRPLAREKGAVESTSHSGTHLPDSL